MNRSLRYALTLADGAHWSIHTEGTRAASAAAKLAEVMTLGPQVGSIPSPHAVKRTLELSDSDAATLPQHRPYIPLPSMKDGTVCCNQHTLNPPDTLYPSLTRLSLIFARDAQTRGGFLIHGALAEKDGIGVILAGPCGTGKTTASSRLVFPWRSLSDDVTLVVQESPQSYRAHPWPTWSRFQGGTADASWDVQQTVPLKGIFVLTQAQDDGAERVGSGRMVSLLLECVKQASMLMECSLSKEELRLLHLEQFNNLCRASGSLPAYILHFTRTGEFWQEIERALGSSCREGFHDFKRV